MIQNRVSNYYSDKMELYKFVKDRELKQNHLMTYHVGDLKEFASKVEISGGVLIPKSLKSFFIFGIKGFRGWSKKTTDKVDISHIIEGDQVPRMIYFVYKLGRPLHGAKYKEEETIEGQASMVERLFTKHKKYPRFHHKSVHHQFMFYACVEIDTNSYKWPDVFLVSELDLKLHTLSQDLQRWNCIFTKTKIQVKNSNVYLRLKTIPTPISNEKIMIYAYLNSIRKIECKNCLHDWTLLELWVLLECRKVYQKYLNKNDAKGVREILNDDGFKLQSKYKSCGLWLHYFPKISFVKENINNTNSSMYLSFVRWLLDL